MAKKAKAKAKATPPEKPADRIVVFSNGPNQIHPEDQRKVVDILIDRLGFEIVEIKSRVYDVRLITVNPRYDPKIPKGPIRRSRTK